MSGGAGVEGSYVVQGFASPTSHWVVSHSFSRAYSNVLLARGASSSAASLMAVASSGQRNAASILIGLVGKTPTANVLTWSILLSTGTLPNTPSSSANALGH